ncbi:hypothetical protein [Haloferula rosea]|uniref:Uncharacterized protein n=1 Tax=Haloferula rosea TaxID=490093 RepID=A0A934VFD7_9BACT|nr:hypothetical protein [Haloferula rosea]MBK1828259.1 hypothetical protein [Haloferula rosea]
MSKDAPASKLQSAWSREASKIARRINLGWWLESLMAPVVVIGLIGTCVLMFVRREAPETAAWQLALGVAGMLAAVGAVALFIARRHFETPERSMVRIEDSMRMRNALSAAQAGVAPWPELPEKVNAGVSWNWQRLVIPPIAVLAFLLAGLLIPVSALPGEDEDPPEAPLAWEQIEADLERLGQDDIIDETYLEEMQKKLDELRSKEEEEWFSHSSLEATDSLKQQHKSELERLQRDLDRAERALGNLQQNAGNIPQAQKDQLLNQFDQALQGLQNGALKPNPDLLDQLQQLDPNQLGNLNQEQLEQLRENMQKAGQACKDCQGGGGGGEGDEWLDELLDGQCEGDGQQGNQPGPGNGNGGVQRGPGHAPGVLGKEGDSLKTGDLESLEAEDLSRSLPGDLLQLQDGEHEVDKSATGTQTGGGVQSTGSGGDRVWRESLDPDEQRTLKRFFE